MTFGETIGFDGRMKGVLPAPCPEVRALPAGKRFPLFRMEKKRLDGPLAGQSILLTPLWKGSMAGLRNTGR
jgi:hypothetical protein